MDYFGQWLSLIVAGGLGGGLLTFLTWLAKQILDQWEKSRAAKQTLANAELHWKAQAHRDTLNDKKASRDTHAAMSKLLIEALTAVAAKSDSPDPAIRALAEKARKRLGDEETQ